MIGATAEEAVPEGSGSRGRAPESSAAPRKSNPERKEDQQTEALQRQSREESWPHCEISSNQAGASREVSGLLASAACARSDSHWPTRTCGRLVNVEADVVTVPHLAEQSLVRPDNQNRSRGNGLLGARLPHRHKKHDARDVKMIQGTSGGPLC